MMANQTEHMNGNHSAYPSLATKIRNGHMASKTVCGA